MKLPLSPLPGLFRALALLLPCALTLQAAPIPADSRITAVTVYADRAVVTRTASIDIAAAGPLEVSFAGLPASLVDQSLQVTGRGTAATRLLDVSAQQTYVDFTPNDRVKALEDELRALLRQDRALSDRGNVLNQQRDYVLKIQTATTTPAKDAGTTTTSTDDWLKLLAFTEGQLARFAADILSVENDREELQDRRRAIEQQLNQLRSETGRSYKNIAVRLDAARTGQVQLTVRYTVPNASWFPAYDTRVAASERAVHLGYFGQVRQNTGEDWSNVELTLSTARPALGGSAPELQPWILQHRQFVPVAAAAPAFRTRMQKTKETLAPEPLTLGLGSYGAADAAGAAEAAPVESHYISAEISAQATSASFKIPVAASIPSDNSLQKIPVTNVRLDLKPEYQATPKLLAGAFLTAKVSNSSEFPLLSGPMNVFLDDTFVATSHLRTVMPGEQFDLALGADEGIAIKRTLNQRFTEDTGVVTKSRRITYDFTITVQNNKATPETLVLVDQVPVSRHEKIVVKQLAPDERQVKPDADGVLKWTLPLAPGEKREIAVKFSVEYPNDLPVTGLE